MEEEVWHIRQIGSSYQEGWAYTIVNTSNWTLPLEQHPLLINQPNLYELVYAIIPNNTFQQQIMWEDGIKEQ
jgi:hypothetical protein